MPGFYSRKNTRQAVTGKHERAASDENSHKIKKGAKSAPRKTPQLTLRHRLEPRITNHGPYCVADFSPSLRILSCSFFRKFTGAFGLKATRYHKGCVRSLLNRDKVAASLFGCRAIFSRIAEYG